MATTKIATESARPSLAQNIENLYNTVRAGGAFNAQKDIVFEGHNERVNGIQERTHTIKGFKTKMAEQMTEMKMAKDSNVVTTRMRTSIYGDHSNQKYWNM